MKKVKQGLLTLILYLTSYRVSEMTFTIQASGNRTYHIQHTTYTYTYIQLEPIKYYELVKPEFFHNNINIVQFKRSNI